MTREEKFKALRQMRIDFAEYENLKSTDFVPYECLVCGKIKHSKKKNVQESLNGTGNKVFKFCSNKCQGVLSDVRDLVDCLNCGIKFLKSRCHIRTSPRHFCNSSCAATYNNKNKTHGTRRSKLEIWLEEKLTELYDFEIHYGRKDAIGSELDIYIPHIKTAFEIHGIFHYEPIYGQRKLEQIQANDAEKILKCSELGIEYVEIEVNKVMSRFSPEKAEKFLNVICSIVDRKTLSQ